MKATILKSLAPFACAVALFAASVVTTLSQDNWETVFPGSTDPLPASELPKFTAIATSPGGHVFAGGSEYDLATDVTSAVLVRSLDRGATWQETARIPGFQFEKVAVDGAGTVYAHAASASDRSLGELWVSSDDEANLERVAEFRSFLGDRHYVSDLAVDGQGTVYISGAMSVPSGRNTVERWVVAKGAPNATGGLDWSLVDQYTIDSKMNSSAGSIAIKPSTDPSAPAQIWVHGWPGHRVSSTRAIRRSLDGGATWQTVNTYNNGGILGYSAVLTVAATGEVYAHGEIRVWLNKKTAQDYYVTRRSLDGGVDWPIVDQSPKHVYGWATAVAVRPDGAVFAARHEHSSVGEPWRWMVRGSPNGDNGTWATSDDGFPGHAESIAIDDEGSVYVAGRGGEWNGSWYGVVRKLSATIP